MQPPLTFDPNGIAVENGQFLGLPIIPVDDASLVLLPVPWDVTTSAAAGTADAPANILQSSYQLEPEDPFVEKAWTQRLHMSQADPHIAASSRHLRSIAADIITHLEQDRPITYKIQEQLWIVNQGCAALANYMQSHCSQLIEQGVSIGLIGGDHSVPLGYLRAIDHHYDNFGILQLDAHMDLRAAYEHFTYSHASIFYNVLQQCKHVSRLVQFGIRDYCPEERTRADEDPRVCVYTDHHLRSALFAGVRYHDYCMKIVEQLPSHVYISFDIDALSIQYCQHTGTPVPGGLEYNEAMYLLWLVAKHRTIIGFDLCEVAGPPHYLDGLIGARITYRLSNFLWASQQNLNQQSFGRI